MDIDLKGFANIGRYRDPEIWYRRGSARKAATAAQRTAWSPVVKQLTHLMKPCRWLVNAGAGVERAQLSVRPRVSFQRRFGGLRHGGPQAWESHT